MPAIFDLYDDLESWRQDTANGAGVKGRAGRVLCDAYASNPVAGALISTANRGAGVTFDYICKPYWDDPEDGYTPPQPWREEVPFEGGQCPSTAYYMIVEYDAFSFNQGCVAEPQIRSSQPIAYIGPIQSASAVCTGAEDLACGQGQHNQIQVVDSNGVAPVLGLGDTQCTRIVRSIRFERVDGQSDTCGNPDPVLRPPVPSPDAPFTPWDEPVDIGEPGAPFPITPRTPVEREPGAPFVPIDTPTGTEPFPIGAPPDPSPQPPAPPTPGDPIDVSPGGDTGDIPPSEDEGRVCIGVAVEFTGVPSSKGGFPGSTPTRFAQTFASIQLRQAGESGEVWTVQTPLSAEKTFISRSHSGFDVVGYNLNSIPSWGAVRITPYYTTEG